MTTSNLSVIPQSFDNLTFFQTNSNWSDLSLYLPRLDKSGTLLHSALPNTSHPETFDKSDVISQLSESDLWLRHATLVSVTLCIAYTTVFVLGIIGNSFVVAVVFRSPRMWTVTNFFIVNLAFADILVLIFCLPATLIGNLFVRK